MRKVWVSNWDPYCFNSNVVFLTEEGAEKVGDDAYAMWIPEEGEELPPLRDGKWYDPEAQEDPE